MYDVEVRPELFLILKKLLKKNKKQLEIIHKKIFTIRLNPFGYKFLRKPLDSFNRVHIDRSFVLIFKIDHEERLVTFYYFGHHDKAYKKRFD